MPKLVRFAHSQTQNGYKQPDIFDFSNLLNVIQFNPQTKILAIIAQTKTILWVGGLLT
jgi:hypothetical protein